MTENLLYRGRFAPTPSGPLHFGSLTSCLGSYLDARAQGGQWLIRIEDVDSGRSRLAYRESILQTLAAHGFVSDEPVRVQSEHLADYAAALEKIRAHLYPCVCSRQKWQANAAEGALGKIYPQTCRLAPPSLPPEGAALRLALPDRIDCFTDRLYGDCRYDLQREIGDPVLRRRDGDIAYALAAAADDALQGITHVVRGADLLAHTPIQRYLQEILQYPAVSTLHLPLVLLPNGSKLSKQNHAPALDNRSAAQNLLQALQFLGQDTAGLTETDSPETILQAAVPRWDIARAAQNAHGIS